MQPPAKPTENHNGFIKAWADAYQAAFGVAYLFAGGKDASAVKRLLASGLSGSDLLALAQAAWKKPGAFNCKQAVSIAGFASRLNEIRAEVGAAKPKSELAGWEAEVNGEEPL